MEFNLQEAKEKTIEFLNQKSYSLVRPDFSKYSQVYLFTTENLSYIDKLDIQNKDILTVTGSFDQCLNLAYKGCKSVCNFDVNVLTVAFAAFKYAALKAFTYKEYLEFLSGNNRLDYHMYLRIKPYMNFIFQEYWDFIYQTFDYSGTSIFASRLFDTPKTIEQIISLNPYLRNENNYNTTKQRIDSVAIKFEEKNVLEIGQSDELYDIMLFSNLETYLLDELSGGMTPEEYINFLHNNASNQLKENGIIQIAYQYQYRTKVNLTGNFLKNLFHKKYKVKGIDYLEKKYRKIIITGSPLWSNTEITSDVQDCIYLYKNELEKRRNVL